MRDTRSTVAGPPGFAATWETWEVFRLEEHEIRDLGDSTVWLGRADLTGRTSHVQLDQEFAVILLMDGTRPISNASLPASMGSPCFRSHARGARSAADGVSAPPHAQRDLLG
jgi:hypothetical protein